MDNLHIGIISDMFFEPYILPLINKYFGEYVNIVIIPWGEQSVDKKQTQTEKLDFIIVWLNLEYSYLRAFNALYLQSEFDQQIIEDIVTSCKKLYLDVSFKSNMRIMWFLFEDYGIQLANTVGCIYNTFVDKLNLALSTALGKQVSFINLKQLIAEVGILNAYNPKGKYRWNVPYSRLLLEVAVKAIYKQYLIEKGITKKCLVLDCDNVLWGGILSEDTIAGLKLGGSGVGRVYQDFQRFVLSLYYHGVILAICSKNDFSDVLMIFREHSEMILKEEQIACFQVNWEDKYSNIKLIAEKLNIDFSSMVFVDDSLVEIEAVKTLLPEVTTIHFQSNIDYKLFSCFNLRNNGNIVDIQKRNATYRTNCYRDNLKANCVDYAAYVRALEIEVDIHEAKSVEYNRISELTQRTNKCTNGKRYTVTEIKERVTHEDVNLYALFVSDRFSELGLVGAIEIEDDTLTLCSLSCRALGRGIEKEIIDFIVGRYKINSIEYYSTGKNGSFKSLLAESFPDATLFSGNHA